VPQVRPRRHAVNNRFGIVRSRGGECDQLQALCCKQVIAGQRELVQQHDLSVVNAPGDLRVMRRSMKLAG
jgi:hypothetical protein